MSTFDMSLDKALSILARVHTRDNAFSGFVVESTARPDWSNGVTEGEYAEAWGTVREHRTEDTETYFHKLFEGNKEHGEWFRIEGLLADVLKRLPATVTLPERKLKRKASEISL